ncbi:MAG: hypothetical protein LQ350_002821 [Teloschistes chrysophthalmus]|nr:MAG: hypothetical protein LQ350_002821 [Niorma chrysophthalma]
MTSSPSQVLRWSSQLSVLPSGNTPSLRGDRIILPPSALEQILAAATTTVPSVRQPQTSTFDSFNPYSYAAEQQARDQLRERQQELPHPLTFRLVNPLNGRVCYAGIREFSAEERSIGLSRFLATSLGFEDTPSVDNSGALPNGNNASASLSDEPQQKLTVHFEEIPKGTYVKLRPLEAGYDPEDWKALLERHLRENFTTLTQGEILTVVSGREEYRFLIDHLKPNDKAISIIDTDLEVDIEPLNEEQARETLKKRVQKAQRAPGTSEGSSVGGLIEIGQSVSGKVQPGEYVDYNIESWDSNRDLEVELSPTASEQDVDLFLTPSGPGQRARPREDEHVFADFSTRSSKRIKVKHTNVGLDNAEALWLSIRGNEDQDHPTAPIEYQMRVTATNEADVPMTDDEEVPNAEEDRCSNCHQLVPRRTMFLHQSFCLRNNTACPHCHEVFQKSSPEWKNHWHCPHDSAYGNTLASHSKHDRLYHTPQTCPACGDPCINVPDLAHHRTTTCPLKPILCQFCHLEVPQRGPDDPEMTDPEVLLSGLTPHELVDGARTSECYLCAKIVRLRDMKTHLKHHNYERLSRFKPEVCSNECCGRVLVGYTKDGKRLQRDHDNELRVCGTCFGPLYSNTYDPEGKALRRRVERRYLSQMLTGCGKGWCRNEYCKSGRANMGVVAVGEAKERMGLIKGVLGGKESWFCADEGAQRRREMAGMVAAERGVGDGVVVGRVGGKGKGKEGEGEVSVVGGGYDLEWCVNALEVEGGDLLKARGWLKDWAPTREESASR